VELAQGMAHSNSHITWLQSKKLLTWLAEFSLALSLVYTLLFVEASLNTGFFVLTQRSMALYHVTCDLVSPTLDAWIWGTVVLLASGWLSWTLWTNRSTRRSRLLLLLVPLVLVGLAGAGLPFGFPLAFASLSVVVLSFIFAVDCFGTRRFLLARNVTVGAISVGLFAEVASLALFNVPAVLNLSPSATSSAAHWNLVELNLSNLAYSVLPYAYLFLIVLGVVAFAAKALPIRRLVDKMPDNGFFQLAKSLKSYVESIKNTSNNPITSRFPLAAAVIIAVIMSTAFVTITVLPWVNPTYRLVSVDSGYYYSWITHMRSMDANAAMSWALGTDRPAFLVFSTLLSHMIPTVDIVQLFPALLIPLLCIVSVLTMRVFCRLRDALIYTALLTPFSVPALALIYSGYFANMLAVILVYVYFILLVKVIKKWSSGGFLASLTVSLLILFTHLGTWFVFVVSLGAFLFLEWRLSVRDRELLKAFNTKASIVGTTVAAGLISEFVRELVFPFSASALVSSNVSSNFGFPNPISILNGLHQTIDFHMGGVFANQLFIFLSVVGFLFMLNFKSELTKLLISWFFVASVCMLFPSGQYIFNRFLFMMPWMVFGGLGLAYVVRLATIGAQGSKTKLVAVELIILAFVFSVLLVDSLRYVTNLNML
jgi:hypothetical protein